MYPVPGKPNNLCCFALVGACKDYNDKRGVRQPIAECSNFDPKLALEGVIKKAVQDGWVVLPRESNEQPKVEGDGVEKSQQQENQEANSFN